MSEVAQETGGNPADAGGAPPIPADSGSSFLSGVTANNVGSEQEGGAVPNGATDQLQKDTADASVQDAMGGPPPGVPDKFWDAENKRIKPVEEVLEAYTNLEKVLGRGDKLTKPDDDDEEGWERVHSVFRPESPDAYDLGERPQLPEGMPYDEQAEESLRNWGYKNGVPQRALKNLYESEVKQRIEGVAHWQKLQQENRSKLLNDLRREHGQQYPAVEKRVGSLMDRYADLSDRQYFDETGYGNDPTLIRLFDRIARDMGGETKLVKNETNAPQAADLDAAIANFTKKNEKALFDKTHPDHSRLVSERDKLFQMRYPEPAA
jgi:hypothetical protein